MKLRNMMAPIGVLPVFVLVLAIAPLSAQSVDTPEAGSAEAIRAATTAERYLPDSVASVPESDSVPSPADVLGHIAGAPDVLSTTAEVHGYFRRLAEASPRVSLEVLGKSEGGREMVLVAISSEGQLANLDAIKGQSRRLADPRRTSEVEMGSLVAETPAVYYLLGGLHSRETGSPEMLMELAYRLAVSERPEIQRMRQRLVVLITPVVEPDGRDRVVEWYRRHLAGRTKADGSALEWRDIQEIASPPYWGRYIFHDNNRDGMQRTQALTRAVQGVFFDYRPQVMHDLHESLPLLYISTGHGPYSPAVDPVTINEWTQMAHHEASTLQAQGLPGVWVWGFWDGWWPGYLVSVAHNHNAVGRFYETFGNVHPGTFERDLSEVRFLGEKVTEVEWYRPWPPAEKVTWSMRNNTNFMQAGVLAGLDYAALHADQLQENLWRKASRAIENGRDEAPHGWVFDREQRDPGRLASLVELLLEHRIEVHRLVDSVTLGEEEVAADSYVVRFDQPARNGALNFLSRQEFPKDEPNPPYDDVAWTWPLLHGVSGRLIDDPALLKAPMAAVAAPLPRAGGVQGSDFGTGLFLLADRGQTSLLRARLYLADYQVDAAEEAFSDGGVDYPVGSWLIQAPRALVEQVAAELGLEVRPALAVPSVRRHVVDLPRVGVVHTWVRTQDAGWARYSLDRQGLQYELVSPDDLRRGGLRSRFDVLLFPPAVSSLRRMIHGIDRRWSPLAYTQTTEFPSHGLPNSSPDITGGMGFAGLLELQRFVEDGGVLAAFGNGTVLPVEGGLVPRVGRARQAVRTPGSELAARVVRPDHPLTYGYQERTSVFRGNGLLFEVDEREEARIVLQFGDALEEEEKPSLAAEEVVEEEILDDELLVEEEILVGENELEVEELPVPEEVAEPEVEDRPLVLSGFVDHPDRVAGKPAIADLPVGQGRVVLYAFNPLHRHLNPSDFRFLFNLILHWNDLPD
ncbi:MAG: M14 family zinc carboxypeptidase [Acidobacteriota bacterium]